MLWKNVVNATVDGLGALGHRLNVLSKRNSAPLITHLVVQKEQPLQSVNSTLAETRTAILTTLSKVENQYQTFIQRQINPLLGSVRQQQQQALTGHSQSLELSEAEKEINRFIGISALAVSTTIIGYLFFPPLILTAIPAAIYLTWPMYVRSYYKLTKEHRVTLALPAALYMTGTWLTGYFLIGSFGELIYYIGEKLVMISEDRSRKGLVEVFRQQPRTVWVWVDGTEVEIPFDRLQSGDTIVLAAGQSIPVDGRVIQGSATIDQHMLTGEAQPAEKSPGEAVYASTLVLAGKIHVTVEKTGEATVAAQIGTILNNTSSYQMSLETEALRFANKAALPVLVLSGVALPTVGAAGAVALLSANFGFNLKMTAPIAMLNFLNLAANRGILIKDGRSLELLNTIDTVIFDKTGTLTLEQPYVTHIYSSNGMTADELLTYAAAAEHRQSHPIARAILAAAAQRALSLPALQTASYEIGYGIKVWIDEKMVRVGSDRFLEMEEIALSTEIRQYQATCHAQGHSLVMVAIDDQLAGAIELAPTIRPEAKEVIADLHKRGMDLYIISGDQEEPTRKLAQELGIDYYFANTLPEDKAALVEQLQQAGRSVCFVGDGINDSIALKKANVSISLRGATSVATDTAQMVLMDQSLRQLPQLFELANDFAVNMKNGFAAALVPGAVIIGGVFLLHFGIPAAILIHFLGLSTSLGIAMSPLLTSTGKQVEENRSLEIQGNVAATPQPLLSQENL